MGSQNRETIRPSAPRTVSYRGEPFAPAPGTYRAVSSRSLNLTTVADSGYGPSAVERLAELGSLGPLALGGDLGSGVRLRGRPALDLGQLSRRLRRGVRRGAVGEAPGRVPPEIRRRDRLRPERRVRLDLIHHQRPLRIGPCQREPFRVAPRDLHARA